MAIAVDPKSGKQRYMSAHTDDIISIAMSHVHAKKRGAYSIVATGEVGRSPKIIVWESHSMCVINTMKGAHQRGVTQLAFSPDGQTLASIGLDDQVSFFFYTKMWGLFFFFFLGVFFVCCCCCCCCCLFSILSA